MILIDVNILVYAHSETSPRHAEAKEWLDTQLSGTTPVGLPWPSLLGFMRLKTNPRIFERPDTAQVAFSQVRAWLASPVAWIPQATPRHADVFGDILAAVDGVHTNLIPDAHLAALAIEHGLQLCSTDGDFARFPKLRWLNPLA